MRYRGPLRDEPLAIELHNTIYATSGGGVDALADPANAIAWLEALAPRLHGESPPTGPWPSVESPPPGPWPSVASPPPGPWPSVASPPPGPWPSVASPPTGPWPSVASPPTGPWPSVDELVALRAAVRPALRAAADGMPVDRAHVDAINAASRRAPRAAVAVRHADADLSLGTDFGDARRADIVLAAFAADAIELLTGGHRDDLRTCGAPGCVLMFLKDHPRRQWCSDRCGNRARQARHYERHSGRR